MKFKFPFLLNSEPDLGGGGTPPTSPPPGAAPSTGPITGTPEPTGSTPPSTPPAGDPPPAPSIGPDGTLGENWYLAMGDEFSASGDDLGKHKNIKSLIEERNYFRSKQIGRPGEDSTPEDIAAYRQHIGIPEAGTAEAYGLDLTDATDQDKSTFDRIAAAFHDKHATGPEAFQAAVAEFRAIQGEEMQAWQDQQAAAIKEAEDQLVADWRGDYEANSSTARHIAGKLAEAAGITPDDPVLQALANTPAFGKIMLEVSKLTSEDRTASPAGMNDLRSNQQRADAIMDGTDPQWGQKYLDGDSEAYKMAVSYLNKAKE